MVEQRQADGGLEPSVFELSDPFDPHDPMFSTLPLHHDTCPRRLNDDNMVALPLVLPLPQVDLPGGTSLPLDRFTVIVGPNSSGKTQLLRDIQAAVCGQPRRMVVVTRLPFASPPGLDTLLSMALDSGAVQRRFDPQTKQVAAYRRQQYQLGMNDGAGQDYQPNQLSQFYELHCRALGDHHTTDIPANPLLAFLSGALCTSLFLENRLTLLSDTNTFDYDQTPPVNLLQSLYLDRNTQELLESELRQVFDRCVWLDYTRFNTLLLRAADVPTAPSASDRRFPEEMRKHLPLSSEGDGLRSYAAVCITLLLSKQPLCLLDEPELCLHPPQAYALGRFIGKYATAQPRGLLVATHSAHVLRGILDSGSMPAVLRLTRSRLHRFAARSIPGDALLQAVSNPRARAEPVLDGFFTECAVTCEAESDRVVYEAAYNAIPLDGSPESRVTRDLRFVPVSGRNASAELLKLYRTLGVPAAAVVDCDILVAPLELRALVEACGANDSDVKTLLQISNEITAALRVSLPALSVANVKASIASLAAQDYDWATGDDERLAESLATLKASLGRLKSIKRGLSVLQESLRLRTSAILDRLESIGLFIVRCGELECWIPDLMSGISKSNKPAWAALAAEKLREVAPRFGKDVCEFIQRIDRYARNRSESLGGPTTPSSR